MAVIALSLWMMYHNDNTGGPRVTFVDQYDQSITSYAYISQRYSHFWIHPYPKRYGKCRMRMLGSMRKRRFIRSLWRIIRQFDATLGYPGEGPGSSVAAILSKYASFVHPGMTRRCRRDKDRDVSSTSHDPVTVCSHKSSDDHIVVANDEVLTEESSSGSSESRVPSVSSIAYVHSISPDSAVHSVRSESISATSSSSSSSNDNDRSDHIREILKKYSHHMITNTGPKKQPKPNDECKSNIDFKAVDQSVTITDVSDDEIDEAGEDNIGPDIEGSSYEAEFDNHEEPHVPVDDCSDDDGPYQEQYADVKVSESILQDVKTQLCFLSDDGKDDSVADDDSCDSDTDQRKKRAYRRRRGRQYKKMGKYVSNLPTLMRELKNCCLKGIEWHDNNQRNLIDSCSTYNNKTGPERDEYVKNDILKHVRDVHQYKNTNKRVADLKIGWYGHEVCGRCYAAIHGFSFRTFNSKLADVKKGLISSHDHSRHRDRNIGAIFSGWMAMKFDYECENLPNQETRLLVGSATKQEVYEECVAELRSAGDLKEDEGSFSYFVYIWNKDFPSVIIPKRSRFAKCKICSRLKIAIKETKDTNKKRALRQEKQDHLKTVFADRRVYWNVRQLSRNDPDLMSIIMDAMDKSKTSPPRWWLISHSQDEYNPYNLKLTGALTHGLPDDYFFFINDNTIPADTNMNILCLMKIIEKLREHGKLKKKLHLQFDNTTAGNKTVRMYAFLGMMVQFKVFEEIIVEFLHVGHTHEDIDAVFSKVAVWIYKRSIQTLSVVLAMLGKFLKGFKTNIPHVEQLKIVPDTWGWLKNCYNKSIKGTNDARSVRIMMKNGWAHIWSKQTMAEAQDHYAPPDGIQLITKIPDARPKNVVLRPLDTSDFDKIIQIEAEALYHPKDIYLKEWRAIRDAELDRQTKQCAVCKRFRTIGM